MTRSILVYWSALSLIGFLAFGAFAQSSSPSPASSTEQLADDAQLREIARKIVALDAEKAELLGSLNDTQRERLAELLAELDAPLVQEQRDTEAGDQGAITAESSQTGAAAGVEANRDEALVRPELRPAPDSPQAPTGESTARTKTAQASSPTAQDQTPSAEKAAADTGISDVDEATGVGSRCTAWSVFDTNADGALSGADRHFRHFFVWLDNGDGQVAEREMMDPYRLGMRSLALDLRTYDGVKNRAGVVERRLNGGRERLRVEILGTAKGAKGADYGILAIDVGAVLRGSGPAIRRSGGPALTEGLVLVEEGVQVRATAESEWKPLLCGRRVR